MATSDIGRSNNAPLRIEPCFGKVGENSVESESEMSEDVLQHDELRS